MNNNICIAISTNRRKKKLTSLLKSIKNLFLKNNIQSENLKYSSSRYLSKKFNFLNEEKSDVNATIDQWVDWVITKYSFLNFPLHFL